MIKELALVTLLLAEAEPIQLTPAACEAAMEDAWRNGQEASCSHLSDADIVERHPIRYKKVIEARETAAIEAQIAIQIAEIQRLRILSEEATSLTLKIGWCRTIARNGSFPGKVYPFSEKEKYWPEGIKLSLDECIRLIGGRRDPTTWEPPEVVVAHLKRGYR
jgi:hypothetical protein